MEKICPICGKDLASGAVRCDNPSCPNPSAAAASPPTIKPRKPDGIGSGGARGFNNPTYVTQNQPVNGTVVAQNNNMLSKNNLVNNLPNNNLSKKPVKKYRQISDDDVEIVDDNHLDSVQHSANHLDL